MCSDIFQTLMSVPQEMVDVSPCASTNLALSLVVVSQGTYSCLTRGHVKVSSQRSYFKVIHIDIHLSASVVNWIYKAGVWFYFFCLGTDKFKETVGCLTLDDWYFCFSVLDTDECKEIKDICSGGVCSNLPGSHRCTCVGGLVPSADGKQCLGKWTNRYHRHSFVFLRNQKTKFLVVFSSYM